MPLPDANLVFEIAEWDPAGVRRVQVLARLADFEMAKAAWRALLEQNRFDYVTWRIGAQVLQERRWSDRFAAKPGG